MLGLREAPFRGLLRQAQPNLVDGGPVKNRSLDELWTAVDELQTGLIRAAIGPGTIRNKAIKPKSVYANTIDVSDLQSVNAKTGNLSVTGSITMTTAGSFSAGQTAYDTGVGWWLDYNAGTPRFSLGNSGGNKITWQGTTLAITGTIEATGGHIGGWTIGATDLTGSAGVIGLASSGSVRIWSGNATPSAAPFQVDSGGNLTATAGAIGGWTIDSTSGLKLGTGASTRGISTGSTAFYAGSATPSSAPFNVTTAGALTAQSGTIGGITINSTSLSSTGWSLTNAGVMTSTSGTIGGLTIGASSLTIPAGKSLVNADGDTWDSTGITLVSAGSFGDTIKWKVSGTERGSIYANSTNLYLQYGQTGSGGASISLDGTNWHLIGVGAAQLESTGNNIKSTGGYYPGSGVTQQTTNVLQGSNSVIGVTLGDAAGANSFTVVDNAAQVQFSVTSNGAFTSPDADATSLGTYAGRIPWYVAGNLRYIPYYNA